MAICGAATNHNSDRRSVAIQFSDRGSVASLIGDNLLSPIGLVARLLSLFQVATVTCLLPHMIHISFSPVAISNGENMLFCIFLFEHLFL